MTLGPLKLLGPFVNLTHDMAAAAMKKTALLSFLIAVIAVLFGGFSAVRYWATGRSRFQLCIARAGSFSLSSA